MGNVGGMGNASQLINMPQGKHCSGCSFPIHTQRPDFSSHHEAERRQGSEETDKPENHVWEGPLRGPVVL